MEPERSRLPAALPVPVAPKLPCGKLAVEVLACELGDARGLGRRRLLLTTTARPLLLLLLLLPAVPAVRAAAGAVALVRLTIDGSRLRSPRAGRAAGGGGGGECGVG